MTFINPEIERLCLEFRNAIMQAAADTKRDELSCTCGVSRSTVDRWLTGGIDGLNFPAFLTAALTDPRFQNLAFEILRFQADRLGYDLSKKRKLGQVNGSMDDEIAGIIEQLGLLHKEIADDETRAHVLRKHIEAIKPYLARCEQEIQLISGR